MKGRHGIFWSMVVVLAGGLFLNSCSLKIPLLPQEQPGTEAAPPQLGLNFIRFYWDAQSPCFQPQQIFEDFSVLKVGTYRQLIKAGVTWDVVEPENDQWNFSIPDQIILHSPVPPILSLFAQQYASPTPPWENDPQKFQKTLGDEAKDYIRHVVERYKDYVTYWELGNEMEHWRAADPNDRRVGRLPPSYPLDGFSPREQGVFLSQAAALVKKLDPDAVIVLPGMGSLSDYSINTWLKGVIEGGGSDWFDVVNYHYYSNWQRYSNLRSNLQNFLEQNGIADKPVWCTETGATSSPTLTLRTNYPNSPESQAAEVFRRIVQAWRAGDALVAWHTYIGSPDVPNNDWRCYGIRAANGAAKPAYYSFKLLANELTPFEKVDVLQNDWKGVNAFKFTLPQNTVKYVAWGTGHLSVPQGVTKMTSVLADSTGTFHWEPVTPGQILQLSDMPVLLK